MECTSELGKAFIGSQFGSGVPNWPVQITKMKPMPTSKLISMNLTAIVPAELVSLGLDVRKEVLNRFYERVAYELTGPDPKPVFIPQIDPGTQIYRGLLLVPHEWPKTPLSP